MMFLGNTAAHVEPDTCPVPFFFGGDIGFKEPIYHRFRDAAGIVTDLHTLLLLRYYQSNTDQPLFNVMFDKGIFCIVDDIEDQVFELIWKALDDNLILSTLPSSKSFLISSL